MNHRGLTLLEVVVIVVVIAILAGLIVPPFCGEGMRRAKATNCAHNLGQLYKLGTVYASTHKGEWPSETGDDLWLSFTKTVPPLIDATTIEILACPVLGEEIRPGETHYRGPQLPWSKLKSSDPLGGDKVGNHGDGVGGNVLYKDGSVMELDVQELHRRESDGLLR
jgi:type II secretory pathway pseudopilin PulG